MDDLILLRACWMQARGISTLLLGLGVFTQMENQGANSQSSFQLILLSRILYYSYFHNVL